MKWFRKALNQTSRGRAMGSGASDGKSVCVSAIERVKEGGVMMKSAMGCEVNGAGCLNHEAARSCYRHAGWFPMRGREFQLFVSLDATANMVTLAIPTCGDGVCGHVIRRIGLETAMKNGALATAIGCLLEAAHTASEGTALGRPRLLEFDPSHSPTPRRPFMTEMRPPAQPPFVEM